MSFPYKRSYWILQANSDKRQGPKSSGLSVIPQVPALLFVVIVHMTCLGCVKNLHSHYDPRAMVSGQRPEPGTTRSLLFPGFFPSSRFPFLSTTQSPHASACEAASLSWATLQQTPSPGKAASLLEIHYKKPFCLPRCFEPGDGLVVATQSCDSCHILHMNQEKQGSNNLGP